MPERIVRRRTSGWRMPEGAIYVGRPTRWGNPWSVGKCRAVTCGPTAHWHVYGHDGTPMDSVHPATRTDAATFAVRMFRAALEADDDPWFALTLTEVRADLRGRDLACWCPLDRACHADVLVEIANDDSEEQA